MLQEKNTYGTNGKPHALTQGPRGAYTYDARGRQDTAPGRSLVTYNERDLPRKITATSGGDTLFACDASGTRVRNQRPGEALLTLGGLYERRILSPTRPPRDSNVACPAWRTCRLPRRY